MKFSRSSIGIELTQPWYEKLRNRRIIHNNYYFLEMRRRILFWKILLKPTSIRITDNKKIRKIFSKNWRIIKLFMWKNAFYNYSSVTFVKIYRSNPWNLTPISNILYVGISDPTTQKSCKSGSILHTKGALHPSSPY